MARSLSAFLAQNTKKIDNCTLVVSSRFVGEDKKPLAWEIKSISAAENAKLRKSCMRSVPAPGVRGQYTQDFDVHSYQAKLAAKCVVYPELDNVELQESYGAMSAEQLIGLMLTAGEFDALVAGILEHNGFKDDGELEEEAKN